MGLFKKSSDPLSARARELGGRIEELESQIRALKGRLDHDPVPPKVRSTVLPQGRGQASGLGPVHEPVFEEVEHHRVLTPGEAEAGKAHFNEELGIRKYDLLAVWRRWQTQFRSPAAANPKLVNYLAAGSIRGLRPLRYEKRVARRRFLILSGALLVVLWGLLYFFFHQR